MLEETAIVVKTEPHRVWITATQNSSCGGCAQKSACTGNALADAMPSKRPVVVDSDISLKVGDSVVVAIEESQLLRASLMLYVLPLLAMLIAAGIADGLCTGKVQFAEIWVAGSALLALLLSLVVIHNKQNGFAPVSMMIKKPGSI